MTRLVSFRFIVLLAALSLLAGCGRAGPPIKPSEALAKKAKEEGEPAPEKPVPNARNPQKRFILDKLID